MKKYLFLLLAVCMVHHSFTASISNVDEYVLATLIQIFDPMTGGEGYNDLEALKRNDRRNNDYVVNDIHDIKNNILNSIRLKRAWKLLTEWSSSIDEKIIQKVMLQEIERFVDNKSFKTAMRKTKNHRVSLKVAKSILEDLNKKYLAASYLSHGAFRDFIGKKLEQRALERCNKFEEPRPTTQRHDLYPSEDCCVCYDSFNEVQRVYLMPCGHDICKDCAQQWFFDQKKNSCPKCRANIDKNDLRLALQNNNRPPAYNPELFR